MANKHGRRQFGWLRKLPSGRWQASYVGPDGFRRVAPNTFPTKADGQAWLTLREAELLRGEWADPDLGKVLLGAYADRWISEHKLSERTRELYEGLFRLHIRPFLGGKELAKITPTPCARGAPSCSSAAVRQIQRPKHTGCSGPL